MTKKTKIASDTVKAQIASLTLRFEDAKKALDATNAENELLRKQNVELASVIENDLKAESILRIVAMSSYKQQDLDGLKIEELQQIEETLAKSKGDVKTPYKSIRAGANDACGRLTVGSTYRKTHKEILEMGGDF